MNDPRTTDLLDLAVPAPRRYGASDPDVLGRHFALLAEMAWCSDDPRHRTAVGGQLPRLVATADEQEFDQVERTRLTELAESVVSRSAASTAARHLRCCLIPRAVDPHLHGAEPACAAPSRS